MCPFHHAAGDVSLSTDPYMLTTWPLRNPSPVPFCNFYFACAKLSQVILWQRRSSACSHGCCDFWQMNIQESLGSHWPCEEWWCFCTAGDDREMTKCRAVSFDKGALSWAWIPPMSCARVLCYRWKHYGGTLKWNSASRPNGLAILTLTLVQP